MNKPYGLWQRLKGSAAFAKSLLLDEIKDEIDVETSLGAGFLQCQLRRSRKTNEDYLVLKVRGGDATVYVPLDESAAEKLTGFIQRSLVSNQPKTGT